VAKILIVEDDQDISRLLGIRLKQDGHKAAFAADAVTAMTVARKEQPDLILLDLGLPGGDGHIVMDRLRAMPALAMVPVIVISAREAAGNEERVLAAGARAFLSKPLDTARLLQEIDAALSG
jgi:DNA-binding response OmpR family regulator